MSAAAARAEHIARERLRAARRRGVEFHLIGPLRDDLPAEVARGLAPDPARHRCRADARPRAHAGRRGAARPRISRPLLRRLGDFRGISARAANDGQPKDAAWAAAICGMPAERDRRAGAARRRPAHARHLLDVAAARRAWRAAGLDGGRAGGDARPDRAAGRRLRLCAGRDLEYRQAAGRGAAADHAGRAATASPISSRWRASPTCCCIPGEPFDYDGQSARPIPTSGWSIGPAATRSTTIRISARLRRRLLPAGHGHRARPAWTATARHADIVLPATITLEREDIGASAGDPLLVAMHRAVPPYGEARDDYAIFAGLAGRLGFADAFTEGRSPRQWLEQHLRADPPGAGRARHQRARFRGVLGSRASCNCRPRRGTAASVRAFRRDPEPRPLPTPSGKIEIASATIAGFGYADCPGHPSLAAAGRRR